MQKYNNRNEVPEEYKWDLTSFFKDDNEFNDSVNDCKKRIEELNSYVGCTKDANKLYEYFIAKCKEKGIYTQNGEFGAHMNVKLLNDGPVTICIDSQNRE